MSIDFLSPVIYICRVDGKGLLGFRPKKADPTRKTRQENIMQTGLSLRDLAAKLETESHQKKDMIVNTGSTELVVFNGDLHLDTQDNGGGLYLLRPLAHDQLAEHIDVPLRYYRRMHRDAPQLLADNVNTWLHRKPEPRMFRTMAGKGRAWLSNRYLRVENELIAEVALNALLANGMRPNQIVSCNVTETKLYIQAVMPSIKALVKGSRQIGDVMQGGVIITNSEVGKGRIDVSEFDFRLICLNGMVGQSLFKKTHLGGALDGDEALLRDDTKRTMDDALILQIRDMIAAAINPERFQARIESMENLTRKEIEGNPAESVKVLTKVLGPAVGLTEKEEGSILNALIRGGDVSAWGLLNAVTAQANTETDYDRAVELEAAGGKLLAMPAPEWAQILKAA